MQKNFPSRLIFRAILLATVLGLPARLRAQTPADTLQKPVTYTLRAGTVATAAQGECLPLWLVANRFGTLADRGSDLSSNVGGSLSYRAAPNLTLSGRLDLYLNNGFGNLFVQQGYLKLNYKKWQVAAGRYTETVGEVAPELSSGALGVSGNALPIPRIGIAATRYVPVPFTGGWVQFKGRYGHGWLGNDRYVTKAFLHEKSFYLRVGKEKWGVYGGGNHFAQWAGVHHRAGQLPNGLGDYLNIVLAGRGGNGNIIQDETFDAANAPGNHLIAFDFGFDLKAGNGRFRGYTQSLFEKGSAPNALVKDQTQGFKLLSPDRLAGAEWTGTAGPLRGVVLEFLSTKFQGGPEFFVGRDNYYNHSIYRTGWSYGGMSLGTPLFINQARAAAYGLKPGTDQQIVSYRVLAGHFGGKGEISPRIGWRTLVTYARHYGNYYNTSTFTPAKTQAHLMQEFTGKLGAGISLTGAVGCDLGDLYT
ncbi:MAG: hypothetical protein ICV83_32375, partial [Cytophagales bacterium]|nr:hypothetical protein [Cytophagales bacterium]